MTDLLNQRRFAFIGFRHSHILSLYRAAGAEPRIGIVAACEADPGTAATVRSTGVVTLTHDRPEEVLGSVECDVVAVGDYYGARGKIVLAALRAGKHVIADKPVCTSLDELGQIREAAKAGGLSVGCMFDLRGSAAVRTVRRLIRDGAIGEVQTVSFTAQHPLLLGSRPGWYFEAGKQGGTLNDIAVHAMDIVPWMTGRRCAVLHAARAWNARLAEIPYFQDAAQFMVELDNGGGLFGDVSYLAPDKCGYGLPQYWRFLIHGTEGMIEAAGDGRPIMLATNQDRSAREVPLDAAAPNIHLLDFLDELEGRSSESSLTTDAVLSASEHALQLQEAADHRRYHVALSK